MCTHLIYLFLIASFLTVESTMFPTLNFNSTNMLKTSKLCQSQLRAIGPQTILQMFDASAKATDGLLYLNMFHLGNFDECYNIRQETALGLIYGKYCLGIAALDSKLTRNKRNLSNLMKLHIGVCVPNGCTTEDIETFTGKIVNFTDKFCYSQDEVPKLDSPAIITLIILGVFIGLVIGSSTYEFAKKKAGKHNQRGIFAFSALSNGSKLLSTTSGSDQLLCLNGIKAISMMWVILGHVYLNSSEGPMGNVVDVGKWQEQMFNMFLVNGTVSVDSFFTVTGLVIVYTFLKTANSKIKFNIFFFYLHRYIRLTPSLAIMVLIHATLLPYLGNGPLWNTIYDSFVKNCKTHWWSTLLYVQNYFHGDDTCVPQSWYLSVDFQLYLVSPLILIPLHRWPKFCLTVLIFLVVLSCAIPFVIGFVYELPAFMTSFQTRPGEMMWKYYKQTYTRFGPYVIGMIAGYFIYRRRNRAFEMTLSPMWVITVWAISLGGLFGCLYAPYYSTLSYNRLSHSLLLAFLRNGWALGLCGVIYLCVAGYGGVINTFLSLPIFQILTKLSYAMYLTHYLVISLRYASMKEVFLISNKFMLWSFWGDFVLTLLLSVILTLTFESPMIALEKSLFGSRSSASTIRKLEV